MQTLRKTAISDSALDCNNERMFPGSSPAGAAHDSANVVIWLRKKRLGRAFLLAIVSFVTFAILAVVLRQYHAAHRLVAATFWPGLAVRRMIMNAGLLRWAGDPKSAAGWLGLGCVFVTHIIFWYALIGPVTVKPQDDSTGPEQVVFE